MTAKTHIGLTALLMGCGLLFWCATRLDFGRSPSVRDDVTKASISSLIPAIEQHHKDCGEWPSGTDGTETLAHDLGIPGWKGPYVRHESSLCDAWGNAFRFINTDTERYVVSSGKDEVFHTKDDIKINVP